MTMFNKNLFVFGARTKQLTFISSMAKWQERKRLKLFESEESYLLLQLAVTVSCCVQF